MSGRAVKYITFEIESQLRKPPELSLAKTNKSTKENTIKNKNTNEEQIRSTNSKLNCTWFNYKLRKSTLTRTET